MEILKLWFSIVELSTTIKLKLLNEFESVENIREFVITHKNINYEDNKVLSRLTKAYDLPKLYNLLEKVEKENINMSTIGEKNYPQSLELLDDAPYTLFYKGDISRLNNSTNVAVVGSRRCTPYGKDITKIITKEMVNSNINVVSGMAKGIDCIAHKTAIDNKGYTAAVLGCGVDVVYPRENNNLYNEIISCGGCIISEFPPGTTPRPMYFPIRNRIISGLSKLIIVAEAGEKSGSLITATRALEQGKDVLAIPGSIFSAESKGTNKLIKEGAHVFTGVEDVFQILGVQRDRKNKSINSKDSIGNNNKNSRVLNEIYKVIDNNPIHIDDIMRLTNVDIKQLYELLFEMQLKDEILCLSGNFYVRVNKSI
ncbi:DNA processing protein [Clostridium punense]|uniref:DNA processing protein n=1 Tax=Clostridium punense TaxID=1054297 RepID=A0ABS4JZ97_9CLOT|nr:MULTISPECIES: DNA-processing protein DprA [Clostridium]EQB88161.1 hypothetical protein M918_05225 [Clostridium sp. BL8]MBP2020316.1 DNA processing protein [Clostridium punense]